MLLAITTTGKVVLLLVAMTFIAFALVTAMVVPRRRPDFPGERLPLYVMASVALFAAQIAAVAWVTGTQEVEARAAETTTAASTTPAGALPAVTATTAAEAGNAAAGKPVFLGAGCTACHTLQDAGATGTVGPSLDEKKPAYELVLDRVTHGRGAMPPFGGRLSRTQIQDLAKYVSSVAGA